MDNADEYLKVNELNIRMCIGEAVPTQIIKNVAYKIKIALAAIDEQASTDQAAFYDSIKDIRCNSSVVRIKAEESEALLRYLPQIAGLFSDRERIEIYCIGFSSSEIDSMQKMLKLWDLQDFVKMSTTESAEVNDSVYDFVLTKSQLSPSNELFQPTLFA